MKNAGLHLPDCLWGTGGCGSSRHSHYWGKRPSTRRDASVWGGRGGRADLGDDLLGGIDAESGDLGETLHRVVQPGRNCGEDVKKKAGYAASLISQLRKSSSAASQFRVVHSERSGNTSFRADR